MYIDESQDKRFIKRGNSRATTEKACCATTFPSLLLNETSLIGKVVAQQDLIFPLLLLFVESFIHKISKAWE